MKRSASIAGVLGLMAAAGVWLRVADSKPGSTDATTGVAIPAGRGTQAVPLGSNAREGMEVPPAAVVVMRDLPPFVGAPASPRRIPGRGPGMPISEEKARQLQRAALRLPPDPTVSAGGPGFFTQGPDGSYGQVSDFAEAVNANENPVTLTPPDPQMAAGPDDVVAVVNVSIAIFDKSTGVRTHLIASDTFFGPAGCSNTFDPNVLYDEEEDRWVIGYDENGTHYCVAFSETGDPGGAWNLYKVPTLVGCGSFFDYPHAGVGDTAIFMGANMFAGSFCEGRVWALEKADGYSGVPLTVVNKSTGIESTPQPMNAHGFAQGTWPDAAAGHYILTDDQFTGTTMGVWRWNDPFGVNTFTDTGTATWPGAGGFPVAAPTAGGRTLTANDFRVLDAEYRNGHIFTTQTVSCNPGGGTVNCIRWAELNPAPRTIVQGGTLGSTGAYRLFGDVAANHCNDMIVGYTGTNATTKPLIALNARRGTMPPGALSTTFVIEPGEVNYTSFEAQPHRWGDYTGATSDPNGKDLWYLGERSKDTGGSSTKWGTFIAKVTTQCPTP